MRKSLIRLVLLAMLIAGISPGMCRASGPLPPMIPPTAAK
jgi:hypothetical protein